MHRYCTDTEREDRRTKIIRSLVLISVILTPPINHLVEYLLGFLQYNSSVSKIICWLYSNGVSFTVSYIATFSLLFFIINHWFAAPLISKITQVPNVSGTWTGILHSTFNGGKDISMTLKIKQSWMNLHCSAIFQESSSESIMARVTQKNDDEIILEFAFYNNSIATDVNQESYYGFNYFTIRDKTMTGKYFTNRSDNANGHTGGYMELTKVSK